MTTTRWADLDEFLSRVDQILEEWDAQKTEVAPENGR